MGTTGREAIESRVFGQLERLGVPYDRIDIDPDFADTAEFCERYGYLPEESGNTILVASKKGPRRFCACIVRASDRLDVNRTVRRLLDARKASFASAEETVALTGMMIGGVTPFDLPPDLPLYVDARVMALEAVILGAGSRSAKVRVAPAVLERIGGTIVEGLAHPPPQA